MTPFAVHDNTIRNPKIGFLIQGSDINSTVEARLGFLTGHDDLVGWANTYMVGVTMDSMITSTKTASEESCGPEPFTATFSLMTRAQAQENGYSPEQLVYVILQ